MAESSTRTAPGRGLPLPSVLFGRAVFYGWYIVAVACLVSMMSMGVSAYGLGVFVAPMTEELGWSRTDISLGQTLSTGVMGFLGIVIGGLVDRRGGRVLIVLGAVLAGRARAGAGGWREDSRMKAVVHTRYGPPEIIRMVEVEQPTPSDDEMLVRVRATTVNRTDCATRAAPTRSTGGGAGR